MPVDYFDISTRRKLVLLSARYHMSLKDFICSKCKEPFVAEKGAQLVRKQRRSGEDRELFHPACWEKNYY